MFLLICVTRVQRISFPGSVRRLLIQKPATSLSANRTSKQPNSYHPVSTTYGFQKHLLSARQDTHVTWGVNLGLNNITNAVNEAKSITAAFASSSIKNSGIVLDAIEIGNEADLYKNNGLRPATYNSTQYVKECVSLAPSLYYRIPNLCVIFRWIAFATSVSAAANIKAGSTTQFWGAAFADSSHSTSGFSPQAIFNDGILSSAPGSLIST